MNKINLRGLINPTLPASYSEALSYLEEIGKLRDRLNEVIQAVNDGQEFYILPIATEDTLGGVKAPEKTSENTKVAVDTEGQIWYTYPSIANENTAGLVKGIAKTTENSQIAIDSYGNLWYNSNEIATETVAGLVKAKIAEITNQHEVVIDENGKLYSDYPDVANGTTAGLVKAKAKTTETVEVAIGNDAKLYVPNQEVTKATSTQIGGIKANDVTNNDGFTDAVKIDSNGFLKVKPTALSAATANTLGGVKAKAKTNESLEVAIGNDEKLYAPLPNLANDSAAGIVKAKTKTTETVEVAVDGTGKLYVPAPNDTIPAASDDNIGGIKAKARTTEDRKIAIGTDNYGYYTIPKATSDGYGGIKASDRNPLTDTKEVKIDSTSGKLYTTPDTATVPLATSSTVGGIKANPVTESQTQPVGIANDGQLYTDPAEVKIAGVSQLGGVRVGEGGTDQITIQRTDMFYPNHDDTPYFYGIRPSYSIFGGDGRLDTYPGIMTIDLTHESAENILPSQIKACISYCLDKAIEYRILFTDYNTYRTNYYYPHGTDSDTGWLIFVSDVDYITEGTDTPMVFILTIGDDLDSPNIVADFFELGSGGGGQYVLPQATSSTLGGIKAATRNSTTDTTEVKIDTSTGKLYCAAGGGAYVLPQATASTLGGVKAGVIDAYAKNEVKIDTATGNLYARYLPPAISVSGGTGKVNVFLNIQTAISNGAKPNEISVVYANGVDPEEFLTVERAVKNSSNQYIEYTLGNSKYFSTVGTSSSGMFTLIEKQPTIYCDSSTYQRTVYNKVVEALNAGVKMTDITMVYDKGNHHTYTLHIGSLDYNDSTGTYVSIEFTSSGYFEPNSSWIEIRSTSVADNGDFFDLHLAVADATEV